MTDVDGVTEIWNVFKSYIPVNDRKDAALQYITHLDNAGDIDLEAHQTDLLGNCDVFDTILVIYCQENGYSDTHHDSEWED